MFILSSISVTNDMKHHQVSGQPNDTNITLFQALLPGESNEVTSLSWKALEVVGE
jgi:hypothetical protein